MSGPPDDAFTVALVATKALVLAIEGRRRVAYPRSTGGGEWWGDSSGSARSSRDPAMARLTTAFVAFVVAEYAAWIGMLVYAYGHGGATAAGLVAFAQLAPGIVRAPMLSSVADRRSPTQLLAGGYLVQALGLAGVALSLGTGAPPLLAYGLAVLASTAVTTTRPALFAALPALARDAQQLTAATVVAGWAENLGVVLSALVASLFLGLGQIGALFAVCAVLVAGGAVLVAPVQGHRDSLADAADRPPSRSPRCSPGPGRSPGSRDHGCW